MAANQESSTRIYVGRFVADDQTGYQQSYRQSTWHIGQQVPCYVPSIGCNPGALLIRSGFVVFNDGLKKYMLFPGSEGLKLQVHYDRLYSGVYVPYPITHSSNGRLK